MAPQAEICFTFHPWLFWGFISPCTRLPCLAPVTACLGTVRRAAQHCGLKEAGENEEWTVYWTDTSVTLERLMEMKRFQVNKTAAQQELLRKGGDTRLFVEQHVAE